MKLRVRFSKFGPVKFIGHLDIMRFVQKAIKAADIPVRYTEGFSPHQVLSFAAPLGVGTESECEYFDLEVTSLEGSEHYRSALNRQMCEGMEILGFYLLPEKSKNAMASVIAASYCIRLKDKELAKLLPEAVEQFKASDKVLSYKETKSGIRERDLKEAVYDINADSETLFFTCDASSGGNLKPSALLEALLKPRNIQCNLWDYQLIRTGVYKAGEKNALILLHEDLEELRQEENV